MAEKMAGLNSNTRTKMLVQTSGSGSLNNSWATRYTYTVPNNGLYFVSFYSVGTSKSDVAMRIQKNGEQIIFITSQRSGGSPGANIANMYQLSVGDILTFEVTSSTTSTDRAWSVNIAQIY